MRATRQQWLARACPDATGPVVAASSDASFRSYHRVATPRGPVILMDAPPAQEDSRPFVDVANRLLECGVNAPRVLAQDLDQGFLLLTDLGDTSYLDALDEASADALYDDAIAALVAIQRDGRTEGLPPYDDALLRGEMALFPDWLLERHLGLDLEPVRAELEAAIDALAAAALEQPRVFVHRDYHSRNLMVTPTHNPGILDFQDAVAGPVSYDLVSLLRDCYIAWPQVRVDAWIERYLERAADAGIETGDADQFRRWFDLMGVQRHLKASGIFARLWHRDGKRGYLADIPRTWRYISAQLDRHRELRPLAEVARRLDLDRVLDW
ncbi:MAG: phosphotransferase [Halofilum sp. (in: g-proteobacteria)]|nr:phosphotransferase [Halofilum sp. (in: g-proteobacteria)]